MTKLKEISYTQNQKEADGKSKKMLTFDFYRSHKDEKAAKSEQNISINHFSKKKKVNPARTELTPINKPLHQLIKKEICQ